MTYHIIKFFTSLISLLPMNSLIKTASAITHVFFFFWKEKRLNTEYNYGIILNKQLGRAPTNAEIKALTRKNRANYGRFNAEFLYLPKLITNSVIPRMRSPQAIEKALSLGKGLVMGTLHFSNWDMAGFAISSQNKNVWAVADDLGGGYSRFIQETRGKYGMNIILPNKNLKDVYRCLDSNGILNVLIDRPVSADNKNSTVINFFKSKARVSSFAARVALNKNTPVSVGWLAWENGSSQIYCCDPIQYAPTGNEADDIMNLTQLMFNEAEKAVGKNPEQWYMFRKFFIDEEKK